MKEAARLGGHLLRRAVRQDVLRIDASVKGDPAAVLLKKVVGLKPFDLLQRLKRVNAALDQILDDGLNRAAGVLLVERAV